MGDVSVEFILMLGYAVSLALIALLLELAARRAHRRSLNHSTLGFTYHPDRDVWICPRDQHLFPVFADTAKGHFIYRAPASACNICPSKRACTDSDEGRQIERRISRGLEFGMQRFHRAMSLTLMVLASLILVVELFRATGSAPRLALAFVLTLFCLAVWRLALDLLPARRAGSFSVPMAETKPAALPTPAPEVVDRFLHARARFR